MMEHRLNVLSFQKSSKNTGNNTWNKTTNPSAQTRRTEEGKKNDEQKKKRRKKERKIEEWLGKQKGRKRKRGMVTIKVNKLVRSECEKPVRRCRWWTPLGNGRRIAFVWPQATWRYGCFLASEGLDNNSRTSRRWWEMCFPCCFFFKLFIYNIFFVRLPRSLRLVVVLERVGLWRMAAALRWTDVPYFPDRQLSAMIYGVTSFTRTPNHQLLGSTLAGHQWPVHISIDQRILGISRWRAMKLSFRIIIPLSRARVIPCKPRRFRP